MRLRLLHRAQVAVLGTFGLAGCLDVGTAVRASHSAGPLPRRAPVAAAAHAADPKTSDRTPDRAADRTPAMAARPPVEEDSKGPKSVLDLQPLREVSRIAVAGGAGGPSAAKLIDLNPKVGAWYLLVLEMPDGRTATYHIENPSGLRLKLDPAFAFGIVMEGRGALAEKSTCELWPDGKPDPLTAAAESRLPYAPLCEGMLYLRNPVKGHRTTKEAVVDLLRDHVWKGEQLTVFVRDVVMKDAQLASSDLAPQRVRPASEAQAGPLPPRVVPSAQDRLLQPVDLELGLEGSAREGVALGRWYPVKGAPGIFSTTLRPDLVAPEVIEAQKGRVSALDAVESSALVYLVAFDLSRLELGFRLGTDHPRLDWSDMVLPSVREEAVAGPDGIGSAEPLVRTGILSPNERIRVAATFTGGFKRTHGAFRWSNLATTRKGSHYGFIENGVVLSTLQPGLATALVYADGRVELKTWSEKDDADVPRIRHARQNGVPILERDPKTSEVVAGARVRQWGAGNWSGSKDKKLRTVRAGLCMQESQGSQYLLYGYFSSATPSGMARVFQACGCSYAMLLDMNALEHTYLAVYHPEGEKLVTQHLIEGMGEVDTASKDGEPLPRFVSVADNRDFFYLLRRENK